MFESGSVSQWCPILCDLMDYSMPAFPVLHYLMEFAQIHVHWVSDAIQTSHPLLPLSPPPLTLSQHQGLFYESAFCISSLHYRVSISPSNEYSGLISFRIDWLDLLAVQGTFKSLFQHHSSKASILLMLLNYGAQPSLWSNSHICTWLLEKP